MTNRWINPANDDLPPDQKVVEGRWDNPPGCKGSLVRECYHDRIYGWMLADPRQTSQAPAPDAWRYKEE